MIGFGGNPGFGVTFSIMRIMVPVIFVLVFGIIIVAMVRGIGEFLVSGTEYGMLAEGDSGELTFQGTRYLNFQRNESAE